MIKKKKLSLLASTLLLALTSCSFTRIAEKTDVYEESDITYSDEGQKTFNRITRSSSGTDGNGYAYQTYSYSISNNSNPSVSISFSFADERENVSNYLIGSVDTINKTFTITCKRDFDSVATARLYLTDYPQSYADITINYSQKLVNAGFDFSNVYNYQFNSNSYHLYDFDADLVSDYMPTFVHVLDSFFTMNVSQYTNNPLNYPSASNYTVYGFDDDATPNYPTSNMQRHWLSDRYIKSNSGYYQTANLDTLNSLVFSTAFSGYALNWDNIDDSTKSGEYYYSDNLLSLYYRLDKQISNLSSSNLTTVKNNLINGKLPCKFSVGGDYVLIRHNKDLKKITSGTTATCYDQNSDPTNDVLESVYIPDGCYFIVLFDWLEKWNAPQINAESISVQF